MNSVINWTSSVVVSGDRFEAEQNAAMNAFGEFALSEGLPLQKLSGPYLPLPIAKSGDAPVQKGNSLAGLKEGSQLPPLVNESCMQLSPSNDLGYVTPTSPVSSKAGANGSSDDESKVSEVKTVNAPKAGGTLSAEFNENGSIRNLPGSMLSDQYGLAAFMIASKSLKNGVSAKNPTPDSPDFDNVFDDIRDVASYSEGLLHVNFPGPHYNPSEPSCFSGNSLIGRPLHPEYLVSQQMVTSCREQEINIIRQAFALKLEAYNDDLLFFIFYNFTQDLVQLMAASYLYQKDWRYHMDDKVWLQRFDNILYLKDPQNPSIERGLYKCFDPTSWKLISVELNLDRNRLEGPPKVPQEFFLPYSPNTTFSE